nr:hypothetical protein CFP56_32124 [Quercus suber]
MNTRQESGTLEIYVPRQFTSERPAVRYMHKELPMSINNHTVARELPKVTESSSIQNRPANFWSFVARENGPSTLEDFLSGDVPQLSLYITSFDDATLVALSFPHTLTDAMGQGALLRAWSLVLNGRESEVPDLIGARQDVICETLDSSTITEHFILGSKQLGMIGMLKLGLHFAGDLLRDWWMEDVTVRHIFMTKQNMNVLRQRAYDEAVAASGDEKVFVSDGDVLAAWAACAVAASMPYPRPVTVLQALNARFRLSSMLKAQGVYVQNSNTYAFTSLPATISSSTLGYLALENRRQLMEQATEAQMLAHLSEVRQKLRRKQGTLMLPGPSNAAFILMTNWTRAAMFSAADFSAAVVRPGESGVMRKNPPGTIVYHDMQALGSKPHANVFAVLGKDHGGNYWLLGSLRPATWAVIEADMARLSGKHVVGWILVTGQQNLLNGYLSHRIHESNTACSDKSGLVVADEISIGLNLDNGPHQGRSLVTRVIETLEARASTGRERILRMICSHDAAERQMELWAKARIRYASMRASHQHFGPKSGECIRCLADHWKSKNHGRLDSKMSPTAYTSYAIA